MKSNKIAIVNPYEKEQNGQEKFCSWRMNMEGCVNPRFIYAYAHLHVKK